MSASEIIEQIRASSPEEQREIATFVSALGIAGGQSDSSGVQYIAVEKAKELSAQIFEENAELFRKLAQ